MMSCGFNWVRRQTHLIIGLLYLLMGATLLLSAFGMMSIPKFGRTFGE